MGRNGHLDRATTARAGREVELEQIAWSDLEQPQAGPQGGGEDARSNTRCKRCAHVIETWRAGAGSSVACAVRRPRRAGVTGRPRTPTEFLAPAATSRR